MSLYDQTFLKWDKYAGGMPDKAKLNQFIIGQRAAGNSPVTVNIALRSFNAFLNWAYKNGHLPELKMKKLPVEKKVMRVFDDKHFQRLLSFRPSDSYEHRTMAIIETLADTGLRIQECLTIEISNMDFDNLLMKVMGKGKKERIVPMSLELRKTLYQFIHKHRHTKFTSPYLFCASSGQAVTYRNTYRAVAIIFKRMGLDKSNIDGFFHMFRRKFARSYVKNGGNVLYLQQAMGHSTLEMTKTYVHVEDEELKEMHLKTSLLSRLK